MALRGRHTLKTWLVALLALAGLSLGLSVSFAVVTANPAEVCSANVCTVTFAAGNEYSFSKPAGVPLTFTLKGGKGGKGGNDAMAGAAGRAGDTVTFSITSDGNPIGIYPGGAGGDGVGGAGNGGGTAGVSAYPNNGYDGGVGGHAGPACCSGGGGGGGAASVVTINTVDYVAAGGSGGAGGDQFCSGPAANAYAFANSTATTYGKPGINASGDGSGSGGGGGGSRGGNGGAMGSCSSETLGYGGYAGLSFAPAGATTTVAGNNATGTITVSYPDKVATTMVPTATAVKPAPITYTLNFAETVTGLTASDFRITGTATGCTVATVPAGTTTYTITVTGCAAPAGSKTVILELPVDSATTSTSRGNAAVTAATVTLDDAAPTVTITAPSPVAQTAAFDFTITGNEIITGLAVTDFTLAGGTCTIDTVTGSGTTWLVHVVGCTNGNVTTLTLKASSLTDLAGNSAPSAPKTLAETLDIPAAPSKLTDAVITGTTSNGLLVGDTLTVSGATFSPANHGNVVYNTNTFVWYRCYSAQATPSFTVASDCQVINGASTASYKITQNDVGYFIRGAMVATNATGTLFSASSNSPVVREYDPLSSTWYATCVVKEGLVYCWGDNAYGQMGDGTTVDVLAPNAQPVKLANGNNLTGVVSIDTGSEHTCALTNQGAMYCWGRNNWSQLGDGTTVAKSVATPVTATASGSVGFGSDVVAISAGEADTCVLKAGGAAYCWGVNDYGQMADGTSTTKVTPTRVLSAASTPLTNITDIEANRYNVCVLSNSGSVTGQVYCAGHGGNGQMANGTVTATNAYLTKAYTSATDATFTGATDISVSSHHICAVRNGAAYCWGINTSGQLGTGNASSQIYPTIPIDTAAGVSFASGVTQVETSKNATGSSCFLKTTGIMYCAGLGTSGQLTDGTIVSKATSVASTLFTTGTWTMSIGELFTCGIDASGLSCIGNNNNGQLGNGTIVNSTTAEVNQPRFTAHLGAVDEKPVAGGATETGYAGTGQLLTGATTVEAATGSWYGYPLPVLTYQWWSCTTAGVETTTQPTGCTAIAGATAKTYTPVAGDVGKFLRFEVIGTNSAGVTGDWSATTAAVGVAPTNSALPTIALKAGSAGTIVGTQAIATAGTWSGTPTPTSSFIWYRCNTAGATATLNAPSDCVQISDATGATYTFTASDVGYYVRGVDVSQSTSGINYAFTATVGPVAGSRTIAAGFNHTCVIKLGYVYCWGYNGYGNLGDGTLVDAKTMPSTPVKIADGSYLKNVESIDASANSTCALTSAGAMYCWGYNGYGELGDGTTTNRSIPTLVTGLSSGVSYMMTSVAHTCAVKANGSLYCWGLNDNGQVGDNTSTQRTSPVQVLTATNTPITDVIQVSGGWKHTCAIKVGGALFCWGYNGNGMLGDGTASARWMPTQVTGMTSGVTDVSAGYYYTCAVKNGAAYCWGYNANGQLGDGTVTQRLSPVAVADSAAIPAISFASGVTDVETSDYDPGYTCFIKQSQKVYCTGANAQGQLGTANTTEFRAPTAPSLFVGAVTGAALGRYHTCVTMDLKVSCIGYNVNGELANGTLTSTSTVLSTQTAFGNPTGALDVSPVSGGATVSGYTGIGQVLNGATTLDTITGTWVGYSYPTLTYQWLRCDSSGVASASVPSDCKPISGATSMSYSATALDVGKYLRFEVIGTNAAGVTSAISATPSAPVGLAPTNTALPNLVDVDGGYAGVIPGLVETLAAGSWSGTPAPAITYKWYRCLTAVAAATMTDPANGDCWAIDSATAITYKLTASDVGYFVRGVEIASSTSGVDFAYSQTTNQVRESDTIAAGDSHTCAIRLGRVYCWGLGTSGQLGDGTLVSKSTPTGPVKLADGSILENVVTIEAQDTATCAATVAGEMYCWGAQGSGEFGDGLTSETTSTPKQVLASAGTAFTGVVAIATGDGHTCAIRTNGSLWCWGYNADGRVGDGTATNRTYPVQIISSGAQAVSADRNSACVIVNSALKCWGANDYNQLGDGTGTNRNVPTSVTNMTSGVTDVSMGFIHTCAIKDGAAFCWGYNGYGQLGDGTTTQRASATQVANSVAGVVFTDDVVNVDASETNPEHTCLTKTGGVLYCFGVGGNSGLANGSTANSLVPSPSTLWTSGVSEVTTGYQFTCVVKDGADFCTGYNNFGQVGNATTTTSTATNGYTSLANYAGALDVAPYGGTTAVTGTSAVGYTLTGASSGWSGFPMPTVSYQWYNCVNAGVPANSVPADCAAISGATNLTYVPVSTDVNNFLRLVATATSVAGVTTQMTAAQFVGMAPDATFIERTTAPAGFIPIGTTITQFADQWDAVPAATVTNAWYRCSSTGGAVEVVPADCTLITGATGTTYKTTQSDVGSYVRGAQIATNSVGTTTALSPTAGYVTETRTVAVGAQSTCVLKAGEVWCAGLGTAGQLGNNAILSSSTPVKVLTAANTPLNKVIDVAGVGYHYCAITETGALYCWGANGNGALGIGTTANTSLATLVNSGTQYAAVDPGNAYTCAIKVGGALYCWGLNTSSQLGDGTVANKSVPTLVTGMGSGVSQVSAGWQSTCAIKNGAAFCWGSNTNYMLGDGTATARSVPTQVGPTQVAPIVNFTSGVTDIAMSTISACLIKDGSAYCWGNAASGQIGTGATTGNAGYPVQVIATASGTVFTSGVIDVEVSVNNNSVDSAYLTKSGGSLYTFGSQVNGVLLNGVTTGNSPRPIAATGYTSGVSEVSAGWGDVCVVKAGALNCAGLNDNGQLFNSPATLNTTPVTTPTAPAAFASGLGDVALAPALVTAPTVDGTPGLANVSAGDPGAFSANPASTLTFKWYTCTLTGGVATAVPDDCVAATGAGATTLNYTPIFADAGKYLRLVVTATNSAGSVTSVSATSAQVTGKGDQSIVFGPVANPALGGVAVTLAATATSTLPVTYSSATPLICTVTAGKVTAVSSGRCEVTATQAGNTTFNAATATLELFIDRTANAITFSAADRAYSATPFALAATASSGLPVIYSATPATVCTVSGANLTMVNVGACQITATQAGSSTVAAATPVVVTMAIGKATQTVALTLPASLSVLDIVGTALTANSTSGGAVTLDVANPAICDFVDGKLVGLSLGTCNVIATQAGDAKFSPVSSTFTTTVTRAPNVSTVTTATATPTKLTSVSVALTFDTAVTGLTASDLSTAPTVCTVASVMGTGANYTVNLTNCAEGPVSLKLAANSVNNGTDGPLSIYTSPFVFTVDRTAPTVLSSTTAIPALTNAATVDYTVTFSEPVTGFTAEDVANSGTATGCQPSVTAVSATVYTVSFAFCSGGTLGVKVLAGGVADIAMNSGPAAIYSGAAAVTLDRAAATVASVTTPGASTKTSPVVFVVTFAEAVTGFTAADVTPAGTATGCQATVVPVSASVYNVSIASCTDGTVGIKVSANSVADIAGNDSPVSEYSSALANLDTVAPAAPVVTTIAPAITNTLPIVATLTFAEPVTGLAASDLGVIGAATGCQIAVTPVTTAIYNATITGCTDGTLAISVAANAVTDLAGNAGPVVPEVTTTLTTIDRVAPAVPNLTTTTLAYTNHLPVPFEVTFAEPVFGLTAADFAMAGTATGCQISLTAVSGTVYNLAVTGCTADGTLGVKLLAASVTDAADNSGPSVVSTGPQVTLDTIAPNAPELSAMPGDYTTSTSISPTFEMDARFTYECEFDGQIISCGAGNMHLGSVANPLADGDHTLKVWVTDQAGNRSLPFSQTWNIGDYVTPEVPEVPIVGRPIRTTLEVNWNEPATSDEIPVVGYELQYNVDGISWITAATIKDPNQTAYELTTARSGLEYQFRVKALATLPADSSGFSEASIFDAAYMPEIASLSTPQSVLTPPAGATLTITGIDFAKGATQVSFGTTPATVVSVANDGTSAIVAIPAATTPGAVDIKVTSGVASFQGASVKPRAFTYTSTASAQTLTHIAPTGVKAGSSVPLTIAFNSGATPVITIAAASTGICRFDGTTLVALKVGTCNYSVSAPASAGFLAFPAKAFSAVLAKGENTTTFTLPNGFTKAATPITGKAYPLTATSSAGLRVTNAASPASVCFVDGEGLLHLVSVGACTITSTSGDANFASSVTTTTFTITKNAQTLSFVAPGAQIPGLLPAVFAPAATDAKTGFKLVASANSGLPLTYVSLNPTVCEVDQDGIVSWIADIAKTPALNTCKVSVTQAGNANYDPLPATSLTLTATHVATVAPPGGVITDPEVAGAIGKNGGKAVFGSDGFGVQITSKVVTITPYGEGILIGPITATVTIPYKELVKGKLTPKTQVCVTKFGITKKMTLAQGALKSKKFTTTVKCTLNAAAFAWFKAGNALAVKATVVRDRRWPTTYLKVVGKESPRKGWPLYQTKKLYKLTIG